MHPEQAKIWQDPIFDTFCPIAESHGFRFDDQQSFHSEAIMYRGGSLYDHYILLFRKEPDQLELRIVKYRKLLVSQPFSTEADSITRFMLFSGTIDANDTNGIRTILQATVAAVY